MGNAVWNGQASFAEVARERSQGPTAAQGGLRDWTSRGSLTSEEMDAAIFTLPVGQMSRIIEGPTGFHIVRVVERHEPTTKPFTEAQVEIREKIRKRKVDEQVKAFVAKLRATTPVWTIFDGPPPETAGRAAAGYR
jgi:parvulin-like peptidyl-prolyl isomerase